MTSRENMIFSPVLLGADSFCRAELLKPGMKAPQLQVRSVGVRNTQETSENGTGLGESTFWL